MATGTTKDERPIEPVFDRGGVRNAAALSRDNAGQPLSNSEDEKSEYRVKQSAPEFLHQGELARPGDVILMTPLQARSAAAWVETMDGQRIKHENEASVNVPRANLAGMARHERVGALETEAAALQQRLDDVNRQLEHERGEMNREIEERRKAAIEQPQTVDPNVKVTGGPIASDTGTRAAERVDAKPDENKR